MKSDPSLFALKYIFDWERYVQLNPDLIRAGLDTPGKVILHWLYKGRFEKRPVGRTCLEVGGSAHNGFYIPTLNVDLYSSMDTAYKVEEERICGEKLIVDVVAHGSSLPFRENSFDFVLASHVIEHIFDPISALTDWARVARKHVFVVVPHRDRTPDRDIPLTTFQEILDRHAQGTRQREKEVCHYSFWNLETFMEMCKGTGFDVVDYQDPDDKIGNGFSVVLKATRPTGRNPQTITE